MCIALKRSEMWEVEMILHQGIVKCWSTFYSCTSEVPARFFILMRQNYLTKKSRTIKETTLDLHSEFWRIPNLRHKCKFSTVQCQLLPWIVVACPKGPMPHQNGYDDERWQHTRKIWEILGLNWHFKKNIISLAFGVYQDVFAEDDISSAQKVHAAWLALWPLSLILCRYHWELW